jgi:polysaccharide chain length determinant protein (PEP-CTERM system associated)
MAAPQRQDEIGIRFEDLGKIIRRRIWWFLIPSALGILISFVLVQALPAVYEAASTVVVEPQGIPETLVESTVVSETEARYSHLQLQILSRENLSSVISDFNLYADEGPALREELIERLREAIIIEPLPPAIVDPRKPATLESFRIAFQSERRAIVADVANRLTRDFREAHLEDRAKLAKGASQFVKRELVQAQTELTRVRQEMTAYREEHQGELPDELLLNTQRRERLLTDLADTLSELQASRDQVGRIEAEMIELQRTAKRAENDPEQRKAALELVLNSYRAAGKTEKHPDVRQTQAEIAALEEIIESQEEEAAPYLPAVVMLQRELRNNQVNINVLTREVGTLSDRIADVELRIANTPRHAAELERLGNIALNMSDSIRELQLKLVDAEMGQQMETDLVGEQFRIVEWASPPESPIRPNRPLWFLVGSVLGLMMGTSFMALREMTDATFHSAGELQQVIPFPVLASVPEIRLPADLAMRRSRIRRVGISSALILLLIGVGTLAFYFYGRWSDDATQPIVPTTIGMRRGNV